jgi:hypothetical protein
MKKDFFNSKSVKTEINLELKGGRPFGRERNQNTLETGEEKFIQTKDFYYLADAVHLSFSNVMQLILLSTADCFRCI